jgi:hypothetical protein
MYDVTPPGAPPLRGHGVSEAKGLYGQRVKATLNGVTTAYLGNYYEQSGSAIKKYYYAGMRIR